MSVISLEYVHVLHNAYCLYVCVYVSVCARAHTRARTYVCKCIVCKCKCDFCKCLMYKCELIFFSFSDTQITSYLLCFYLVFEIKYNNNF